MLAASLPRLPAGSTVFDLGSGNGDVILSAVVSSPGCTWIGLDLRVEALKELARRGGKAGSLHQVFAVCCSVRDVPSLFPAGCADAVTANPPYGIEGRTRPSPGYDRALSRRGPGLLLHEFLWAASHLLRPGGRLCTVNRPANLDRVLTGCSAFGMGVDRVQPVGEAGSPASLVVVSALRGRKTEPELLPMLSAWEIALQSMQ